MSIYRTILLVTLFMGATGVSAPRSSQAQSVRSRAVLTLEGAKRVLAAAEATAARLKSPGGAIAIVDDGGHVVLVARLDGTFPAAAAVSIGKARTAAWFRKETAAFESAIANGRVALVGVDEMVPLMGGVPIVVDGQIVGAIGLSGAASQQQDDEIARTAAAALSDPKAK